MYTVFILKVLYQCSARESKIQYSNNPIAIRCHERHCSNMIVICGSIKSFDKKEDGSENDQLSLIVVVVRGSGGHAARPLDKGTQEVEGRRAMARDQGNKGRVLSPSAGYGMSRAGGRVGKPILHLAMDTRLPPFPSPLFLSPLLYCLKARMKFN